MVNDYFRVQGHLVGLLADARDKGFDGFKDSSSQEFNQQGDASTLELFEAALALVPAGGALFDLFKALKVGTALKGIAKVGEQLEKISDTVAKPIEEGTKPGVIAHEVAERQDKAEAADTRFEFRMRTLDSLLDLKASDVLGLDDMQGAIEGQLDRHARDQVDLVAIVRSSLSEVPEDVQRTYRPEVIAAGKFFEIKLYKEYYLQPGSGHAHYVPWERPPGRAGFELPPRIERDVWDHASYYEGLPPTVLKRLRELDGEGLEINGKSVGEYLFPDWFSGAVGRAQLERQRRQEQEQQAADETAAADRQRILGIPGQSVYRPHRAVSPRADE